MSESNGHERPRIDWVKRAAQAESSKRTGEAFEVEVINATVRVEYGPDVTSREAAIEAMAALGYMINTQSGDDGFFKEKRP